MYVLDRYRDEDTKELTVKMFYSETSEWENTSVIIITGTELVLQQSVRVCCKQALIVIESTVKVMVTEKSKFDWVDGLSIRNIQLMPLNSN